MPSSVTNTDDRNYLDLINQTAGSKGADKTSTVYNMVVEDKAKDSVGFQDLFQLMINQLSNQDFLNPVDDSQYLAQMTQIASMSAMQELAKYSQSQYYTGFLGKEVTATKYSVGGQVQSETGVVTQVNWNSKGEYEFTVNGKRYGFNNISFVKLPAESGKLTEKDAENAYTSGYMDGYLDAKKKEEDSSAKNPTDTKPSDPADTKPSDPADTTPSDPADTKPSDPADTTPSDPADTTPSDPADTTPSDPADTTPSDPADTEGMWLAEESSIGGQAAADELRRV